MTLHSQNEFSIPEETVRVVRAAYPKGNLYMNMRDALGPIYQNQSFAHVFPAKGRPVEVPWRLAFITVVQSLEGLPDRQAAEAVGLLGAVVRKDPMCRITAQRVENPLVGELIQRGRECFFHQVLVSSMVRRSASFRHPLDRL